MPSPAKGALLFVLFSPLAIPAALAQAPQTASNSPHKVTRERRNPQPNQSATQSLSMDDRLAILGTALDSPHHPGSPSDCSHFVHGLYQRAGFPYQYASSSDLYAGVDQFRRVSTPQPGDLVVWPGHTGIVTNPAHHAFFSLLSSGPGVDSYATPYWKRRGRPRFFRYIKSATTLRSSSLRPANDF